MDRQQAYHQTLQMQIQQHELQKQQDNYEKLQQQNIIKERAAVVKSFEEEMKLQKHQNQANYRQILETQKQQKNTLSPQMVYRKDIQPTVSYDYG